jgi:PAS domain S-box-containing protein
LFIVTVVFVFFVGYYYKQHGELQTLKTNITKIKNISKLINDLQQERGLSSGFLGSDKKEFKEKLLIKRKETNRSFDIILSTSSSATSKLYKNFKNTLNIFRNKIDTEKISTENSFDFYTNFIQTIQENYLQITTYIDDIYLNTQFQSYTNLAYMKEALGQIRATVNGILTKHILDDALVQRTIHAKGIYDISKRRFEAIATHHMHQKLFKITNSKNYLKVQNIIQKYLHFRVVKISENPNTWFDNSTQAINELYDLEQEYLYTIDKYLNQRLNSSKIELIINTTIFFFTIFLLTWLSYKLRNGIMQNISLLEQYKNAVDRSSIVSKTDIRGRITYANDKFCAISGYTQKELLGKPHSIVRHPDMPKSAFRDMWATILEKKPWFGIVKNKKKDGGEYIVEVTINPILSHDGKIEEFIAIRNDITSVIKLHEDLEHTQEDLIYRMGEIGETRSQETGFHVKRVAKYSELLAKYYGLSTQEINYLKTASPMHDIGKVGIPDSILNKPGKLTQEEWSVMKTHANIGYELFRDSDKPLLKTAAIIAHEHHEKYDGSGYPRRLKGEKIHIYGRITALADVFDALGSDRCYKKAWDDERIFRLIQEERGKHFDPKLVDIFFEHLDKFLAIRDNYKDTSSFMQE